MIYLVGYDPLFNGSSLLSLYDIENEYLGRTEKVVTAKLSWVHPRKKNYNHDFILQEDFYTDENKVKVLHKYIGEQFYTDEKVSFWVPSLFSIEVIEKNIMYKKIFDNIEVKEVMVGLDESKAVDFNYLQPITHSLKQACLKNYTANLLKKCAEKIINKSEFSYEYHPINKKVDELIKSGIFLKEFISYEKDLEKVGKALEANAYEN